MKDINRALRGLTKSLGIKDKMGSYQALEQWTKIAGDEINKRTQASHIRNGVLFVGVDSAPWLTELHMCKGLLIKKINNQIDSPIRDIFFFHNDNLVNEGKEKEIYKKVELSEADHHFIAKAAEKIDDDKIREKFILAMKKHKSMKKS